MSKRINEIAKLVAHESKVSGIDDFGCLYDKSWNLSEAEWTEVCAEADRIMPTVIVTRADRAAHSAAMNGYSSACWAQSRAESAYCE